MSILPANPTRAFPRLSEGHEIPTRSEHSDSPPSIPPSRISAHSAVHSPGRAFSPASTSPSSIPDPQSPLRDLRALRGSSDPNEAPESLPAFSDWLEHEYNDPQRARLQRHAANRADPSERDIEDEHQRRWNYKDRGTPPARAQLPLFDPPSEEAEIILREIADSSITYADIARRHTTSFEALCLWLARPDIAERFRAMRSAAARRAHFVVADNLANIAQILVNTLRSSSDAHEHSGYLPKTTRGFIAHLRSREDIRKSANLLLRIARFDFQAQSPSPRGTALPGGVLPFSSESNSDTPSPMGAREGSGLQRSFNQPNTPIHATSEAPSLREGVGGREDASASSAGPTTFPNSDFPGRVQDEATRTSATTPPADELLSAIPVRIEERDNAAPSAPPIPFNVHIQHPPSHIPHQTHPAPAAISPPLSNDSS